MIDNQYFKLNKQGYKIASSAIQDWSVATFGGPNSDEINISAYEMSDGVLLVETCQCEIECDGGIAYFFCLTNQETGKPVNESLWSRNEIANALACDELCLPSQEDLNHDVMEDFKEEKLSAKLTIIGEFKDGQNIDNIAPIIEKMAKELNIKLSWTINFSKEGSST